MGAGLGVHVIGARVGDIQGVFDAMRNGEYAFGREDLPFMEIVEIHADQIPFAILLRQINETLILHKGMEPSAARVRTLELLDRVRIRDPESRL